MKAQKIMRIATTDLAKYQEDPQADHYILTDDLRFWTIDRVETRRDTGTVVYLTRGSQQNKTLETFSCAANKLTGTIFRMTPSDS